MDYQTTYEREGTYWWYVARLYILEEVFKHFVSPTIDLKILNLGGGTGLISERFAAYGEVVTIDYADQALTFCKSRELRNLIQADASVIPLKNNIFDVIIALDLLEHLDDDIRTLKEIKRVMRADGRLILTVPAYKFMWSRMDDLAGHKKRYIKKLLLEKIDNSGMIPIKVSYFNTFLFPFAFLERAYERIFKPKGMSWLPFLGSFLNKILRNIFSWEIYVLKKFDFPYGLSIIMVAKKQH